MKKSLLYLLIQTISLTIFSQSNDYELIEQHNQIKSSKILKEIVYEYFLKKDGTTDSALVFKSIYDKFGYSVEEYLPTAEQKMVEISRYANFYAANGALVKRIEYNKDSLLIGTTEYVYDSSGNEIRIYKFNSNETEKYTEQKLYNKNLQIVVLKKTQFSKNKVVFDQTTKYYYNQARDLVKEETYFGHGYILNSLIYEYDKSLNKKTAYSLNNGEKIFDGEFFYNNAQQVVIYNSLIWGHSNTTDMSTSYMSTPDMSFPAVDLNLNQKLSAANTQFLDPTEAKQKNGSNIITGTDISGKSSSSNSSSTNTNSNAQVSSPSSENIKLVQQNIYNTDHTISETIITVDGKRVRSFKHYYATN